MTFKLLLIYSSVGHTTEGLWRLALRTNRRPRDDPEQDGTGGQRILCCEHRGGLDTSLSLFNQGLPRLLQGSWATAVRRATAAA